MSVFIKGLIACSVGPLKLCLRISFFGYHLLSLTSPEISRGAYAPHPILTVEVSDVALRRVKTVNWYHVISEFGNLGVRKRNSQQITIKYLCLSTSLQFDELDIEKNDQ